MTVAELIEILSKDWPQDDIVMTTDLDAGGDVEAHSVRSFRGYTILSMRKQAETEA